MKSNKTRLATVLTLILVFFGILIILRLSFFNTDTKNKIAVSSRADNSPPTCTSGFYVNKSNTDGSGCAAACGGEDKCRECLWGGNIRYECINAANLPSCSKPRTYASFGNCTAENPDGKCTQCKIGETPRWEYNGKGPKLATPSPTVASVRCDANIGGECKTADLCEIANQLKKGNDYCKNEYWNLVCCPIPTNTPEPGQASGTPQSALPSNSPTGTNRTQNTYHSTCTIPPNIPVDTQEWAEVECGHILISDQNGEQIFRECPGPSQGKSCKYSCYKYGEEVDCDSPLRPRRTLFNPRNMTVLNKTGESITLSGGISNGSNYHNKLFNEVQLGNGDYVTASYYSCVDENFVSFVYTSGDNSKSYNEQPLDCKINSMLIELKSGNSGNDDTKI